MTAQFLQNELSNLLSESKRKNSDLRNAADKSLQDLKAINPSADIHAELSNRSGFLTPFLIACGTKNAKLTAIAVTCLQRLIISKALARTRLREVLEAFREAANLGVDIQLKILQALPSLLLNYADDLQGPLLGEALLICALLQGSKMAVINNTAAATLSQIVISIFDKVVAEDGKALEIPATAEAPTGSGNVAVRPAALDAYRVFYDICLLTEGQKPSYLRFNDLPRAFGLELIESVLTNHADIFLSHPEQAYILQTRVAPLVIRSLSERLTFAATVRITRILYILIRRHLSILSGECEVSLGLLIHMLEPDSSQPWKRALCMEVFRGICNEPALIRSIFAQYDGREGGKPIVRDLMGALTRLATEKPTIIGLGSQTTAASLNQQLQKDAASSEQAALEAGGVSGIIGSVGFDTPPGLGSWSVVRVPCMDQLDKSEPPTIPESYVYYLTLICINSFSEGLAKFVIPLGASGDSSSKRKSRLEPNGHESEDGAPASTRTPSPSKQIRRRASHRTPRVPVNPLTLESHPQYSEIKIASAIVEACWPAILAASSTFLFATLENELYNALVRSFQKFAHVSGLLRLSTPRDAFLTSLAKSAVPSNVLSANVHSVAPATPVSATSDSLFSNAKGLLGVNESSSSIGAGGSDYNSAATLNVRNLRCLRALLNLGIALGPTLGSSWTIVLQTLQQADFVLYASTKRGNRHGPSAGLQRTDSMKLSDPTNLMANLATELTVVESAANKLFECTRDFPDEDFVGILSSLCKLLGPEDDKAAKRISTDRTRSLSPGVSSPTTHKRIGSVGGLSMASQLIGDNAFALAKMGELAAINMVRLIGPDAEASGWSLLVRHLVSVISSRDVGNNLRYKAAEVLNETVVSAFKAVIAENPGNIDKVQRRILDALKEGIDHGYTTGELDSATRSTEVEIHHAGLEALNAILRHSGESLVAGWETAFDIIATVFDSSMTWKRAKNIYQVPATPETPAADVRQNRSVRLIRSAFSSLELICSDFLASLPTDCVLVLIDALFAFCSQKDDLNISLTTITFFWNASDFLQTREDREKATKGDELTAQAKSEKDLLEIVERADVDSHAALWMLLLLRLTGASTDQRAEVRNGSIQTLFRIFDTYGHQLGPQGWSSCLEIVVFKMMRIDPESLAAIVGTERKQWDETIKLVLGGIGTLYSNYFDVFAQQETFTKTWSVFIRYLETLLSWKSFEVSASVFEVLARVLDKVKEPGSLSSKSLDEVWVLWSSQGTSLVAGTTERKGNSIQDTLTSYITSFRSLYRLLAPNLDKSSVRRALELFKECLLFSDAPPYFRDIEAVTPLQTAVLDAVQQIRTDLPELPSLLLTSLADISTIPYTHTFDASVTGRIPTCIALSIRLMEIIQTLVTRHISNPEIYLSSALTHVLHALEIPIARKYALPPPPPKRPAQWVFATCTVLAITKTALPMLDQLSTITDDVKREIWKALVTIIESVLRAEGSLGSPTRKEDEDFDIKSFGEMRGLMIPGLGREVIPDTTVEAYVKAVFGASMLYHIHGVTDADDEEGGLDDGEDEDEKWLKRRRYGCTEELQVEVRQKMGYECVDELFKLVAGTRGDGEKEAGEDAEMKTARRRVARVAEPWLIRRVGMVLGCYVADQPLRGRMPQPVIQRTEMLYVLKKAVELKSDLEDNEEGEGDGIAKRKDKRHLVKLFPLLSGCVAVAQPDQELLRLLSRGLAELGGAAGWR